jgi:hypothetical protein
MFLKCLFLVKKKKQFFEIALTIGTADKSLALLSGEKVLNHHWLLILEGRNSEKRKLFLILLNG